MYGAKDEGLKRPGEQARDNKRGIGGVEAERLTLTVKYALELEIRTLKARNAKLTEERDRAEGRVYRALEQVSVAESRLTSHLRSLSSSSSSFHTTITNNNEEDEEEEEEEASRGRESSSSSGGGGGVGVQSSSFPTGRPPTGRAHHRSDQEGITEGITVAVGAGATAGGDGEKGGADEEQQEQEQEEEEEEEGGGSGNDTRRRGEG